MVLAIELYDMRLMIFPWSGFAVVIIFYIKNGLNTQLWSLQEISYGINSIQNSRFLSLVVLYFITHGRFVGLYSDVCDWGLK